LISSIGTLSTEESLSEIRSMTSGSEELEDDFLL
jgi:hypothetical protein